MGLRVTGGWTAALALLVCSTCVSSAGVSPQDSGTPETLLPSTSTPGPAVAIWVNGQPIYVADYGRALARYEAELDLQGIDPGSPEAERNLAEARGWILDWMVTELLMVQAAEAAGIVVAAEQVDREIEQMVADVGGDDAFADRLEEWGYTADEFRLTMHSQLLQEEMKRRVLEGVPTVAEHVHARHIVVDTRENAESILDRVMLGADFAALAQACTLDSSTRESGGDLGFFPRGILVLSEVEDAAFALEPGQWGQVVASSQGYHVVQVLERDPTRTVSAQNLRLLQERALQQWTEQLWAQAVIERPLVPAP
jgi:hypothetical protein